MKQMNISWSLKPFTELTVQELYAILQLRNAIFVVEQACVFQDADNKDQVSFHVMCWHNDQLAGYTRLVPAGISYREPSIGRVVISPGHRSLGLGRELMLRSITILYTIWGKKDIRIGAQFYLKKFYESLGFQQCSEPYLDDGVEHIEMLLPVIT